ncbi:GDSL-type esterase/lipase family protein [Lacibacterium aquatile]|uniref:GDSL-type esterase/lipase family protein n=1 Tax=Lacibacterium aquatile TaxID=1168082 RepID=A0ABW5DNJ3_9PROT
MRAICFIGASTVEGMGDKEGIGWPGRLRPYGFHGTATFYNLGIRGQPVAAIAKRWRAECEQRISTPKDGAVVLSFGVNDTAQFEDGSPIGNIAQAIEDAAAVAEECRATYRTLWVGPLAVNEAKMPFFSRLHGKNLYFRNERLSALNEGFKDAAAMAGIAYVDAFTPLSQNPEFAEALARSDGLHPDGQGYALAAEVVGTSEGWRGLARG